MRKMANIENAIIETNALHMREVIWKKKIIYDESGKLTWIRRCRRWDQRRQVSAYDLQQPQ